MKHAIEYVESFAVMALIAMGLTGASYHLFRDGGWLDAAGTSLIGFIVDSPLLALAAIVSAVILTWLWHHSRSFQRTNGKAATGVFYLMLAGGAFFLGRLVMVGSL